MSSPGQPIAQKIQLRFSKTGALRFLSHHDIMRLFARACRRARLPVRLTQGFAPRPRLVFATALELGVESLDEALEVELTGWMPPGETRARLAGALPGDIGVHAVRLLPPRRSGERPVEMVYRVSLPEDPTSLGITPARLAEFMAQDEMPFERPREKRIQKLDLRPSLASLKIENGDVIVTLRPTARGAARPAEIMSLLTRKPLTETKRWPTTKTSMTMVP